MSKNAFARVLGATVGLSLLTGSALAAQLELYPPASTGIGYQWKITMKPREKLQFVNKVGAKSWNEPTNAEGLKGWTHTSDWIALELNKPARITLLVERQMGVLYGDPVTLARSQLYPALSIYRGWDTTSSISHQYNPTGDIPWSTVAYQDSVPNDEGKNRVSYSATLPAGQYSIAIGGNPPSLGDLANYPASNCNPVTDFQCYTYTGNHGYRATITTAKP